METFLKTSRSIALSLVVLIALFGAAPAMAQPAPQDARYIALQVGITESAVIQIMQTQPTEVRRSSWAGIERTKFVFDLQGQRYTISFFAARLVTKTVEAAPSAPSKWSLF